MRMFVVFSRLAKLGIRPYHTLLLREGKERVCKSLPLDASPQLRKLIDAANPLKSFDQLQVRLS